MTLVDEVVAEFTEAIKNRPDSWREGQAAFNHLYKVSPGWADHIRGGPIDPFHMDERLPAFFDWLPGIVLLDEEN